MPIVRQCCGYACGRARLEGRGFSPVVSSGGVKDRKFNHLPRSISAPSALRQPTISRKFFRQVHTIYPKICVCYPENALRLSFSGEQTRTLPSGSVRSPLATTPRNALIELVLRKGLDQKIFAARAGRFPQRRAVGRVARLGSRTGFRVPPLPGMQLSGDSNQSKAGISLRVLTGRSWPTPAKFF